MTSRAAQFPRVLIVGQDFDEVTGGGITLSCLFKAWPRDRIAVAAGGTGLGASGFAGHYYRLGSREDRWIWPLSAVPRESWKVSGPFVPGVEHGEPEARPDSSHFERPSSRDGRLRALGRRVGYGALRLTGADDLLRGLHLSDSFLGWVADYRPDVIYSQLASLGLVRVVGDLARETRIPVALHFMDDWPTTLYRGGLLGGHVRRRLGRELGWLLDQAALLMVISDDMARAFAGRYGHDFLAFHNALDLEEWAATRRTSWAPGHPFEILYAGKIGMSNEASLLDVARATEALAGSGMDLRLAVLTPDVTHPAAARLHNFAHVGVLPAIPHAEIPARLARADLLVLPLDFGKRAEDYARFSMPTKTVEYMASGTPTLVYAPAGNAVSRYAATQQWGYVVGRSSGADLTAGLRLLAENAGERERLAQRSVELALTHHDAGPVRDAFRTALESIVRGVGPGDSRSGEARSMST